MPNSLRDCILQPIPKPGKDPSSSDNYRPIALAPTLSKVFELCLLNEYRASFTTSSLQFGFKRGLSADLCTGLIKNVIARYCNEKLDHIPSGCIVLMVHVVKGRQYTHRCRHLNRRDGV